MRSPWAVDDVICLPDRVSHERNIATATEIVTRVWPWLNAAEVKKVVAIIVEAYEAR